MEFVWVPAGEFLMGSESGEADDDESPVREVRISAGYWLGKHEVTQGEWEAVMGSNPSDFQNCGRDCPVERVSWEDVQAFIGRLNGRSGGNRYRLPSEAEWEYAARAGTSGDRYGADMEAIGWHSGNSGGSPRRVGRKAPNAWGLHDMLGNVWEWVEDWYGDYAGGYVTDPRGPATGSNRVYRGGSWYGSARSCRSSNRNTSPPATATQPRVSPSEDRITLCTLTLSPFAARSARGLAGSREGGRPSARTERRAACPALE